MIKARVAEAEGACSRSAAAVPRRSNSSGGGKYSMGSGTKLSSTGGARAAAVATGICVSGRRRASGGGEQPLLGMEQETRRRRRRRVHIMDTLKNVGTVDMGKDFRVGFVDLAMSMNLDATLLTDPLLPELLMGGTFVRVAPRRERTMSATPALAGTFGSGVRVVADILSTLIILPRVSVAGWGSPRTHFLARALRSLADALRVLAALNAESGAVRDLFRIHLLAKKSSRGGARRSGCTSPARDCLGMVSTWPPTMRVTACRTRFRLLRRMRTTTKLRRLL